MSYTHSCKCEHKNVKYCKHCLVAYCEDCHTEWVTKSQGYWYYPYTWPYGTLCSDNTGAQLVTTSSTTCSHEELS